MKRRTLLQAAVAIPLAGVVPPAWSLQPDENMTPMPFGFGGAKKMLYDVRQRPQAVYLNDTVYIGFKGGAGPADAGGSSGANTHTMLLSYDPESREFSKPITFGKRSTDHHHCPVVWADETDHLHLVHRCHNSPGTHLVAKRPGDMGESESEWSTLAEIAPMVSYPTVFRIYDDKELIYFRTGGHSSSWSYRVSDDNGQSWSAPPNDVTNMDLSLFPEWSSYQAKILSRDGKYLHVVFTDYDDVKSNDPQRLYNPRYEKPVRNDWKYNLSYLRINLQTHEVSNFEGEILETPVDYGTARTKCQIWDTVWRGAGVPPALSLDEQGNPEVLHVLSEENTETHGYYYVRFVDGDWHKTRITGSNHQWNSGYLKRDDNGQLNAYVITGEGYFHQEGVLDSHGGGRIEHWVSRDRGDTWSKRRDITPDAEQYPGWRFNNVQPVLRPDGTAVDGMLIFYGWPDPIKPDAVAFLLDESDGKPV
jgi:hypothetical protein